MFRTAPDRVVVSEKSRRDHVSFILWKIRRMRYLPSAWNLGFPRRPLSEERIWH